MRDIAALSCEPTPASFYLLPVGRIGLHARKLRALFQVSSVLRDLQLPSGDLLGTAAGGRFVRSEGHCTGF
jgi:hypothetical protein